MNYLNLEIPKLNSAEVVGSDPVERGTWLMLSGYCADQENGGRIVNCRSWKDRMWQQLAGVTLKEVLRDCDLWSWDGDDLVVWGYPVAQEQEAQLRRERAKENGARGGRPKKTDVETQSKTHKKPTLVSTSEPTSESVKERKDKDKGKEGNGSTPLPPSPPVNPETERPLCTIEQAVAHAPMVRMTEPAARHWWHTRNAAGWTRGSSSGGAARKITSWQSDMATSADWAEEAAAKAPKTEKPQPRRCT